MINDAFEGKEFLGVPDTVYITGKAYIKTPEAKAKVLEAMAGKGYEFQENGTYASLKDIFAAQCGHCNSIISSKGVAGHNHKCEACDQPTSLDYVPGGTISFYFRRQGRELGNPISFRIHKFDDQARALVLHAAPLLGEQDDFRPGLFDIRHQEDAIALLENVADLYTRTKTILPNGEEINTITIPHEPNSLMTDETRINTTRTTGSKRFFSGVSVYEGKVYHMFDPLPVPQSISLVFEEAAKAKLSLADPKAHEKIMSAAGQVSRVDYYYQDGRPDFSPVVYERWNAFMKHNVDVDYEEWEKFIAKAPKDGPNFINALAKWCAQMSDGVGREVRDEPNMWNTVAAIAKGLGGEDLSFQEKIAAADGLADFSQLIHSAEDQRKARQIQRKSRKDPGLPPTPEQG